MSTEEDEITINYSPGRCPTMEETERVPAHEELDYYHAPWYEDISYEELRSLLCLR